MTEKNFEELTSTDSVREAMQRIAIKVIYFDSDLNIIDTVPDDGLKNKKALHEAALVVRFRQSPDRAIEICVLKNRFGEPNGSGSVTLKLRGLT